MLTTLNILLLILLGVVFIQDLRERRISAILLPLLGVGFCLHTILEQGISALFLNAAYNLLFVLVQIAGLFLFVALRQKSFRGIADKFIGWGDLLFFVVLCLAFSPANMLVFFTFSLILCLLIIISYNYLYKKIREIPLAGLIAAMLCLVLISSTFIPAFQLSNDKLILNLVNP